MFLTPSERRLIDAAVARLIPSDESGPGAIEAGVVDYLDSQLAGAWGAGERLYRAGPWLEGLPTQGYQLPQTPAEMFRQALRGISAALAREGSPPFESLPGEKQDAVLTRLQNGQIDLGPIPAKVFFESLLESTIEGYFGDPAYGGNREMVSWRLIGFPGAYANYYHLIDRYGIAFDQAPTSFAQDGHGHVHGPAYPKT